MRSPKKYKLTKYTRLIFNRNKIPSRIRIYLSFYFVKMIIYVP